ncbi:unnamed protein product [Parnassius apollo]|uniref:(apollo) hypothetical protein n=1 Tax=Parnassius apollo TaxID=110799 RepID=A0A8S3W203_PARAO|nr:unnamed protein product [Parnassius apollo]
MPVDRMPPPTQSGSKSTLLAAQADNTKVPTLSDSELTSNVSKRSKRRREEIGESEMLAFKSEILCVFGEFEKKQQQYFLSLQSLIEQIKEQNAELQESAAKYDGVLERLVQLTYNIT